MPRIIALTASPANMERLEGQRVVTLDRSTGETWSATAGDYFYRPHNRPFLDQDGRPMILVRETTRYETVLP